MKKTFNMYISVVIVAAGKGARMNSDINKQYTKINGKPVIAHTIQKFEDCSFIDEIILVINRDDISFCNKNIIAAFSFNKVKTLVAGGDKRQVSVFNGLREVNGNCDIVLIHDGARPFVKEKCIIDSIYAASEFGASCVAVPVKDTIKKSHRQNFIKETLDRSGLWSIQTPQTFRYSLIMEAHKKASQQNFAATDDAILLERLGVDIKLVEGTYDNIKITTREDLAIAEVLAGNN